MSKHVLHVVKPMERTPVDVSSMEDQELCEIVRGGRNSDAFGELYKRHRDVAMAQAYKMTRDRNTAEDLVSETFARVFRALSNGNGPKESFLGYVLISLRSEAIRVAQDDAGVSSIAPDVLREMNVEYEPDFSETLSERDQISRAFAVLSDDARRVLWLLDVEQTPIEQAAEFLGSSTGAVRVLAHRSRKKLATAYLQQYVEVTKPGCTEVAGLLAEYVRKGLGKRANLKVEDHLPTCQHCVTQVTRLGSLQQQLRVWAGPMVIGGVGAGVATAGGSASAPSAQAIGSVGRSESTMKVVGWIGLGAGVALLIFGALTLFPRDTAELPHTPVTISSDRDAPSSEKEAERATQPQLDGLPSPGTGNEGGRDNPAASADLLDGETPVPVDDTTPNWKLQDG